LVMRMQPEEIALEKLANGIADLIVDLVERNDGPVTLAQIDREIPGFAKKEPPAWCQMYGHNGETFIWDGMTEAGNVALRKVMYGRRVAIQFVNKLPYIVEGCFIENEHWWPIVLLPARAANLESPVLLIRASQKYRDFSIKKAVAEGKLGHRLRTPGSVRYTADQFSV
jgi:hypothetical protein